MEPRIIIKSDRFFAALCCRWPFFSVGNIFCTDSAAYDNANTAGKCKCSQPKTAAATPQHSRLLNHSATPDTTPNRLITIKSPLYEVTLDSKRGSRTSGSLLKNVAPRHDYTIYADGATDADNKSLTFDLAKALAQAA